MGVAKMKNIISLLAGISMLVLSPLTTPAKTLEVDPVEKSFTLRSTEAGRLVAVANVWGSIKVTGHSGDLVEMKVAKTIKARSERDLQSALEEVTLEITERDGLLDLYVDGPFRHDRWHGRRHECRYSVYYEFDLKVPYDADIDLRAVNDGRIMVRGVSGDYVVKHVNGDIEMEDIAGSGEAYTVNGDVRLDFEQNPRGDCRFGSLNGEVRMHFKPGLSADFQLKTVNGNFYTDFELKHVPSVEFAEVVSNGGTVYRAGHTTVVRAGRGGPAIELDGFNGDMFLLEKR
jgi:hypothetical protein